MYTKRHYGFWMTFNWSKKPFFYGLIYAFSLNLLHLLCHDYFELSLPWQPVSLIGIAVAFYLGFKNNSSYDRVWEARKIWGSIVNNSRSFGAATISFVQGENEKAVQKELIYRHIAWLTALRFQLRLSKEWEHIEERIKGLYAPKICEDYFDKLDDEAMNFISETEFKSYKSKANMATQILATQSKRLQELRNKNYYDDFRHMELHQLMVSFYADQGKSERIKNFPFPRQYASAALWVTIVFCVLFPLGMLDIFENKSSIMFWLCPIFSAMVTWVFFLMEMIGDYSENPFEGTYNDVPITAIARGIEIDMRQMIDDANIPEKMKDDNGFLL